MLATPAGWGTKGSASPASFYEPLRRPRIVTCQGCGESFETTGSRAKWCPFCLRMSVATQRLRHARKIMAEHGVDLRLIDKTIAQVMPKGMVTRAQYLAGESPR